MSQTHSLTHKCLAFLAKYPLFVDRFGRSLRFSHLEFDKEAISEYFMAHSRVHRGWILSYFRELSFSVLLVALFYEIFKKEKQLKLMIRSSSSGNRDSDRYFSCGKSYFGSIPCFALGPQIPPPTSVFEISFFSNTGHYGGLEPRGALTKPLS